MFEYQIQKSWERSRLDFGMGRNILFLIGLNLFLLFAVYIQTGSYYKMCVIPILLGLIFYFLRWKIIRNRPGWFIALLNVIVIAFTIVWNYLLIGRIDQLFGQLPRLDTFFVAFDQWLFGQQAAELIDQVLRPMGTMGSFIYDYLIINYALYFFIPLYGAWVYYHILASSKKYKMGRYFSSLIIFYSFNYLLYLFVPVTGPQYFLADQFIRPIPFGFIGQFIYQLIQDSHSTYIDCYPSGHLGIASLVTIWFFKINHPHRFMMVLIMLSICLATLALRYHYSLDLFSALPLAIISYKSSHLLFPESPSVKDYLNQ